MNISRVMLHHERIQIIQELIHQKPLSTLEILNRIPWMSQASLYRHIKLLEEYNIIYVEKIRKVRGSIEKYYSIQERLKNPIQGNSVKQHQMKFLLFMIGAMKDFDSYIQTKETDLVKNGVTFQQGDLHIPKEKLEQFVQDYVELIEKYNHQEPSCDVIKRRLTTMILPLKEEG